MLAPGNKKLGVDLIWGFGLPSGRADVCVGKTPTCRRVCDSRRTEQYRIRAARQYELNLRLTKKKDFVRRVWGVPDRPPRSYSPNSHRRRVRLIPIRPEVAEDHSPLLRTGMISEISFLGGKCSKRRCTVQNGVRLDFEMLLFQLPARAKPVKLFKSPELPAWSGVSAEVIGLYLQWHRGEGRFTPLSTFKEKRADDAFKLRERKVIVEIYEYRSFYLSRGGLVG